MRRILSLFIIVLAQFFLSAGAKAQTQASSCPSVRVESKPEFPVSRFFKDLFCPGGNVTFTATVEGAGAGDALTFNWTVPYGTIMSGQGTATIRVSTSELLNDEITATVEVGGLLSAKPECERRASKTVGLATCCMPPCPTLTISCPTDFPSLVEPVAISLNVSGGEPGLNLKYLKYNWKLSAGKIVAGQGTPQISVDVSETAGESVTATVEVEGLPPECDRTESCSFLWEVYPPTARKFDEYGALGRAEEESRLTHFGIQLQEEPDSSGYVIVYGRRDPRQSFNRIRQFLVSRYSIDPHRLVLVEGGRRSKRTAVQLWMVSAGADPPGADPNF
jgi:hypothetical protein